MHRTIRTPKLEIAYLESGPATGPAVILMHGWPSDAHDWGTVATRLSREGFRVLVPYIRGFGPTRFLDPATPRSGQQAAIGADLHEFMDALGIDRAVLGGYDWGGRAANVVAALWPERVRGLLTIGGYQIQNIAAAGRRPADAAQEHRYWYQWYFHTPRGRAGLTQNRGEIARFLWRLWSPNWNFDDATFAATAASFDNPDYIDVTVNSYCHRYGNAPGDPAYDELERQLAAQPKIGVPTIVLHGEADGVTPPELSNGNAKFFTARYERRVIPVAGHFLSRETPEVAAAALRELAG
ncbi:MAG TPA: alpha/beta hydrolase [Stellaceae bacterium]|nr:alpha/beta hydrolase [Stellaceae bacterium]